jgi:hypothetical protein
MTLDDIVWSDPEDDASSEDNNGTWRNGHNVNWTCSIFCCWRIRNCRGGGSFRSGGEEPCMQAEMSAFVQRLHGLKPAKISKYCKVSWPKISCLSRIFTKRNISIDRMTESTAVEWELCMHACRIAGKSGLHSQNCMTFRIASGMDDVCLLTLFGWAMS